MNENKNSYINEVVCVNREEDFSIEMGLLDKCDFPLHTHNFYELVIILKGTGVQIVNDNKFNIASGDVFIIKDSDQHCFKNTKELKLCNITYYPENLTALNTDLRKIPGYYAMFVIPPASANEKEYKSQLQLGQTELSYVIELISLMKKEYELKTEGFESLLTAYIIQLIVFLSRAYSAFDENRSSSKLRLAEAITYLEKNYHKDIYIKELADIAGLSVNHFTRTFKDAFRMTPIKYLNELRIRNACQMLKNTNKNITEIAYDVGYSDSNYFSRVFKNVKGLTPRRYRKSK